MKLFITADEFNKFINTASRAALMELYKQNQKIMKSKKNWSESLNSMMDNLDIYPILRQRYGYSRKDLL